MSKEEKKQQKAQKKLQKAEESNRNGKPDLFTGNKKETRTGRSSGENWTIPHIYFRSLPVKA